MKRKFEELRENLDEFALQNDYPVLVVGCTSEELPYAAKFLQSLEEGHPADFILVFPQPFPSAASYLNLVVENLRIQLDGAEKLRAERGEPPFPPLPAKVADERGEPEGRLRALLEYFRTLLPNEQEHRAVVGFLPLQCADFDAYARLFATILPVSEFPPWMAALRVVVYDDRNARRIGPVMAARKVERALSFDVDFSTPALTNALSVDAADTSLPVAERMACMVQLAALDYSYKRYPDALEKYGLLYKYYEGAELPPMASLCLLGAGDTLRASGQPQAAKEMLQRGIALAMEHKALAMLLNGLLSIVEVCFELGDHADAESYADSGGQVAAAALNPYAYADLCERKGDAQLAQGRGADALASYEKCRQLCQMYEYPPRWESVLKKVIRVRGDQGAMAEKYAAEQELAQVQSGKFPKAPPAAVPESPPPATPAHDTNGKGALA
jgi:tetratricopeptide (TPR) repeat protein